MISPSFSSPSALAERFNIMLALFAFDTPKRDQSCSILCRVLDGRDLENVCPVDEAILSREERAHYSTVRDPRQRALAFRTRAELRRMLGREIGIAPNLVPLDCDGHGKPRCPHPRAQDLAFSVSHSDQCAMIAIGEAASIGVDLERLVPEEPADELLEIVFDEEELAQWRSLPAEARQRAFTEAWTVKEAAMKAQGMGLDGSPHDVSVSFTTEGRATPRFRNPNWIFERVDFCPCFAACCVVIP
jgi:4'-phosphopantetheinyl transferase